MYVCTPMYMLHVYTVYVRTCVSILCIRSVHMYVHVPVCLAAVLSSVAKVLTHRPPVPPPPPPPVAVPLVVIARSLRTGKPAVALLN
jgi:hypothetical protein